MNGEFVKVLQRSGARLSAFRSYITKGGRIRDFHGWLVTPGGSAITYGKDRIIDVALSTEYTYDEGRAKVLDATSDAVPGAVFAYEVTEQEDSIFTHAQFAFQETAPVLVSRYSVTLPAGWEVNGTVFNRPETKPSVSGNTYTWELRNLAPLEEEPAGPSWAAVAPRLVLTYFPSADAKSALQPIRNWASLSVWQTQAMAPQAEVTAEIRAKAAELTANAKTEVEKIRAIAEFTQKVNYVEVATNLTRGGGYIPHAADYVLEKNYGDCKDKANLMRTLLKATGIDAYIVTIYAGDRDFVRPEWPSPQQFNHAIAAVKVSADVKLPTVIEHPKLGRLLIFDPTSSYTPFGDLPEQEQGSYALVLAGPDGELVRMPQLPATANRLETTVEGQLDATGRLTAHTSRQFFGQSAIGVRRVKHSGDQQLTRGLEHVVSAHIGKATITNLAAADHPDASRFDLGYDFSADAFAHVQGGLLVFRPGVLTGGSTYAFAAKERKLPVKLEGEVRKDVIALKIPSGYRVDEMPDPVELKCEYGTYHGAWTEKDGVLRFEQTLEVNSIEVPAAKYGEVRKFFDQQSGGQHQPVVLTKM